MNTPPTPHRHTSKDQSSHRSLILAFFSPLVPGLLVAAKQNRDCLVQELNDLRPPRLGLTHHPLQTEGELVNSCSCSLNRLETAAASDTGANETMRRRLSPEEASWRHLNGN